MGPPFIEALPTSVCPRLLELLKVSDANQSPVSRIPRKDALCLPNMHISWNLLYNSFQKCDFCEQSTPLSHLRWSKERQEMRV